MFMQNTNQLLIHTWLIEIILLASRSPSDSLKDLITRGE